MLQAENIECGYGEVQVIWDVSVKVEEKQLVTIIGSNGSGKTTFLKALMGVIPVLNGKVIFKGEDITKIPTHSRVERGMVMVPEGRLIFPNMTVLENLEMGAYTKRAEKKKEEQLEHVFNLFPRLKERLEQKAGTLSGGEQQMLAIARALMSKPKLLLLDEPSIGLAPIVVENIGSAILEINEELGISIILVEQNIHLSLEIADYAYVLSEGRIKVEGKAEDVKEFEEIRKAYFGV